MDSPKQAAGPSVTRTELFSTPGAFLGLGFGSGLAPIAPGTFGTLVAIPLYLGIINFGYYWYLIATFVIIFFGVWICGHTAKILRTHDHPAIVWDEFAGYFVTMAMVPPTIANVVAGFFLFRLFDIVKPWPIKWADQKVEGGLGIMLDDLIAGIFAGGILWLTNSWYFGN